MNCDTFTNGNQEQRYETTYGDRKVEHNKYQETTSICLLEDDINAITDI